MHALAKLQRLISDGRGSRSGKAGLPRRRRGYWIVRPSPSDGMQRRHSSARSPPAEKAINVYYIVAYAQYAAQSRARSTPAPSADLDSTGPDKPPRERRPKRVDPIVPWQPPTMSNDIRTHSVETTLCTSRIPVHAPRRTAGGRNLHHHRVAVPLELQMLSTVHHPRSHHPPVFHRGGRDAAVLIFPPLPWNSASLPVLMDAAQLPSAPEW
ncbi:hypothetical protein CKAH01_11911 [Colletotrichum kahawae]|uniref:Uncharacterized protein n=1 Tax=Colletotrichum kahawae TaxID=34407 RepID=A0AAE0DFT6_COLKA|nr:hypothetical protein CKAH01_11911 [Colletotrichum kahawae]